MDHHCDQEPTIPLVAWATCSEIKRGLVVWEGLLVRLVWGTCGILVGVVWVFVRRVWEMCGQLVGLLWVPCGGQIRQHSSGAIRLRREHKFVDIDNLHTKCLLTNSYHGTHNWSTFVWDPETWRPTHL